MLQAGLILIGVPGSWYEPLIGAILVVAVIVNVRLSNLNLRTAFSRFSLDRTGDEANAASLAAEGDRE